MKVNFNEVIAKVEALDIRFPTSLDSDGSDVSLLIIVHF